VHTDIRASAATTDTIAGQISDFGLLFSWLIGSTFFPVSGVSQRVLESAGVGGTKGLVRWGPMVDTSIFTADQDAAKVAAERKKLTYGQPDRLLLTYVGRFSLEKNVRFLVDAMKRAPDNVTLALIGDGPLGPDLAKAAQEMKPKVFCEPKFQGREAVALALAASDIGVSASCMETTGFCAIESIACGVPFLAADALGFHEHLTQGKNARLWTPGKTDSFDEALRQFIEEKKANRPWEKKALVESVRHACLSDCTDRALECYTHRLERGLLAQVVAVPIGLTVFVYNMIGEKMFSPTFPSIIRHIFSIPIWGAMGIVLPTARTLQPVCSTRLSMVAALGASVSGMCYAVLRLSGRGSSGLMPRLSL